MAESRGASAQTDLVSPTAFCREDTTGTYPFIVNTVRIKRPSKEARWGSEKATPPAKHVATQATRA